MTETQGRIRLLRWPWAVLLALAVVACSSVPRFTRPDLLPPHHARELPMQAPAAESVQPAPAPDEGWAAGRVWRTTVSWYGDGLQGRRTASGEPFDLARVSAAHRELPFGTWLQVKNLANGKKLEVRVNDRGPFKEGRDLDLSREAARRLGFLDVGTATVEVRVLSLP